MQSTGAYWHPVPACMLEGKNTGRKCVLARNGRAVSQFGLVLLNLMRPPTCGDRFLSSHNLFSLMQQGIEGRPMGTALCQQLPLLWRGHGASGTALRPGTGILDHTLSIAPS